ncbi:ABC transporter permease [Paenibacillus sp. JSM ZJ436]|uniref:Binding-protein-dependent transport systems inner membrane component n=1 Tax=Paenibacillus algicola TaxID=2565926 RepID=A0A4P8XQE8_9BACL|nr:ABC transporter permease subunit [Paenibacillus algicola]QCT04050.1 binding-protein-dependent transport systems inner membrane component [Paenibacillus algicola]
MQSKSLQMLSKEEKKKQPGARRVSGDVSFLSFVKKNHALYVMLIPVIFYFIVFKYVPLLGSVIAFKNYNIFQGFLGSEWVGFKWFELMFNNPMYIDLFKNTMIISFYQIVFAFPAPIILACLLNEVRLMAFKRGVQTVLYLPHFLSWALVYGLAYMMFSTQTGMVNNLFKEIGEPVINFLQSTELFRTVVVGTGIWKEMGWSTIIFLAALSGINPSLYEAAKIDGAGRWKQFIYVTLPGLMPAITILLLLKIGNVLDVGFEQIYIFLNPVTLSVGEVLDTYSYRLGILNGEFSLTTAIGLFKSVIGFILLVSANQLSKRTTGESLY